MTKWRGDDRLRSFGRAYTKRFGLLARAPYHEDLTLLQSRILFEIQLRGEARAGELVRALELDKGYVSRSIAQLVKGKVIAVAENPADKREKILRLSPKGTRLFGEIDRVSRKRSQGFLSRLRPGAQREFVASLAKAELLMGETPLRKEEISLRGIQPGDLGWVIGRHGEVYAQEYGWNTEFENLVGEIAVAFVKKHDPKRERAWIAEARGIRLGCIFLVKESQQVAKLRILLVDPAARGLGLGSRLVRECLRFARKAGYRKVKLWTNSVLHSARRIYEGEGFRLVKEEPHHSFGKDLIGQFWELDLTEAEHD